MSKLLIEPGEDRPGSRYRLAMLKQYTDDTFTKEIPQPDWKGYVGPTLKAEDGDTLFIHFKNMASRPYNLHPHGIQYEKDSEGALYADGTKGDDKLDDVVKPGYSYVYKWVMTKSFVPTKDDDACIPQGYHSHIRSHKDVDTGTLGMLIVCKKGVLNPDDSRKDKDVEFVAYLDIDNGTNSHYAEQNLQSCLNPEKCRKLFEEKNGRFSNVLTNMYSINGYTYGNGPDFKVYEGDRVVIYCMGLNLGVHALSIQGQTFTVKHKRVSSYQFGSAVFESYNMVARNPGRWLMYCRFTYHYNHGMVGFMNIKPGWYRYPPQPKYKRTRRFFIAAEEDVWDYRPSGKVLARVGKGSEERSKIEEKFFTSDSAIGGKFVKAMFKEYTDGTFTKRKHRCREERHMGNLGPAIRVEPNERLEVIFKNKASRQFSFYAFGLTVTKEYEGALYKNNRYSSKLSGLMTQPGETQKYVFTVSPNDGPTKTDPQCITSSYQSFSDYSKDIYSGLVGPLLICRPGTLNKHGKQRRVDKEFFLMFMRWYELDGWYIKESLELAKKNGKKVNTKSPAYRENNAMRAINGRVFGNIDGFDMCLGDTVSWHLVGFGERFDLHAAVFEGNNVQFDGRYIDHFSVVPGRGETAFMKPDNPGTWLLYGGQLGYQTEGMVTKYYVHSCNRGPGRSIYAKPYGIERIYYIAAKEITWDYVPNKINTITMGDLRNPKTPGNLYVRSDDRFIGTTYQKAVYRMFTDGTFTKEVKRRRNEKHLGLIGNMIKGAVGDTIKVVYKNMASFDNSISLGNLPIDNRLAKIQRQGVKPGDTAMYRWTVPERSGPGPNEPNCVGSSYMSPVFPQRDIASGLVGPLIICRREILDEYGNRKDNIKVEYAVAFVIFNEGQSFYLKENIKKYAPKRKNLSEGLFREANLRYSMNGFSWQNIPHLDMCEGDNVALYSFSFGSFLGAHTQHLHAHTFIVSTKKSFRNDVHLLIPGAYETIEMLADTPGTWMIHCHVGLHVSGGMFGVYNVFPKRRRYGAYPKYQNMRNYC